MCADGSADVRACGRAPPSLAVYRKQSGGMCLNIANGELIPCKRTEYRSENPNGARRSMVNLQLFIEANFRGTHDELHVAYTYSKQVFDSDEAKASIRKHITRLRFDYPGLDYICVTEPHSSGAWHHHLLLRGARGVRLFIPQKELEALWGKGTVWVSRLNPYIVCGRYFTSPKKLERLHYYPARMRLFSYSKRLMTQ